MLRVRKIYNGETDTDFDSVLNINYYYVQERHQTKKYLQQIPWTRVEYPMYCKTRITPRIT